MSEYASHPTKRAYAAAVRANVPTIFEGLPGVGKTATITADGQAWGFDVLTVVLSIRDASDLLGLPYENNGATGYLAPEWAIKANAAERAIIFLDELNTADPSTLKAGLRLLQERWVGDLKLNDSVYIVGAINPTDVAVDAVDLPPAIANRAMHLPWYSDLGDWMSGVMTGFANYESPSMDSMLGAGSDADKIRASQAVVAFLRHRPTLADAMPTDLVKASKGWPSRRSWTNAMAVLGELNPDDQDARVLVLTGLVGEGAAIEFLAWEATAGLFDPVAVMNDPGSVNWATETPDKLFVLAQSVAALGLMATDPKVWNQAVRVMGACAQGGKPDAAFPSMTALMRKIPKGQTPDGDALDAFGDLFSRSGKWAA